jgi:C4-dicarboxylate-specific signal transduction histidine kinase
MELSHALTTMSVALQAFRVQSQEQVASLEEANLALVSTQEDLVKSEKLATIGRLAAGIAHEVGNPLAAVVGYVDLLSQGLSDAALEEEILERCGVELERIQRIIGDLLEYARPQDLPFEPVAVNELLETAISRVRLMPAFQGLALSVSCQSELPNVVIQKEKVDQVLLNLLINASDALSGKGSIQLEAKLQDEWVAVYCLDDGPGFEPTSFDQLFDPFFTTKPPGAGTGLGLAISLRIAQTQSGKLEAGNRDKGGAWVCLKLPSETA